VSALGVTAHGARKRRDWLKAKLMLNAALK
jgi:hypothetical protein